MCTRALRDIALPMLAAAAFDASAATIPVAANIGGVADDGFCSLAEAVQNANDDSAGNLHGDCAAGDAPGADTLVLPDGAVYTLSERYTGDAGFTALPDIVGTLSIEGNGAVVERASTAESMRLFAVRTGSVLDLRQLMLHNGLATGRGISGNGGAVTVFGRFEAVDCSFTDHQAEGAGGALWVALDGQADIVRSTFSSNVAGAGGAALSTDGALGLSDSTLSGNRSAAAGAAIEVGGDARLVHLTIAGNFSDRGDAALSPVEGRLTLVNSLFAGNGQDCDGLASAYTAGGSNLDGDGSCAARMAGVLSADAQLEALADNGGPTATHALAPDSPARDAADDAECAAAGAIDQRGAPRPLDGDGDGFPACDLGSFEAAETTRYDFGDAAGAGFPTLIADDGAYHVANGPSLGATRDSEPDGQPSPEADGDGGDEDGVRFGAAIIGGSGEVTVSASAAARLDAWIDFDGDEVWREAERIATNLALAAGDTLLGFAVPAGVAPGPRSARFRLSSDGGLSVGGFAADGEVEDHRVVLTAAAPPPELSIADAAVDEGDAGTVSLAFELSLSAASDETVSVRVVSADDSASVADGDYLPLDALVEFAPGQTLRRVELTVVGDVRREADERLRVMLGDAVNAVIVDGDALGTIRNDDPVPALSLTVDGSPLAETGGEAVLVAVLSHPSDEPVTALLTVEDGDAQAGADFSLGTTMLMIAPGALEARVALSALDDALDEADETAVIALSTPANTVLADDSAVTVLVLDDDAPPQVAFVGAGDAVDEGAALSLQVRLSAESGREVTIPLGISGDATAGEDFTADGDSLQIPAGALGAQIEVQALADASVEGDETVRFSLQPPINATLGAPADFELTIVDTTRAPSDLALTLSVSPAVALVGETVVVNADVIGDQGEAVDLSLRFFAAGLDLETPAACSHSEAADGFILQCRLEDAAAVSTAKAALQLGGTATLAEDIVVVGEAQPAGVTDPNAEDNAAQATLPVGEQAGEPPQQALGCAPTWALALADFDGDGGLDLLTANADSAATPQAADRQSQIQQRTGEIPPLSARGELYRGDRSGHFGALPQSLADGADSRGLAVADFDGDGHPDYALANAGANRLYFSRGDSFTPGPALGANGLAVAATDLDGDGLIDLVFAGPAAAWWRNTGGGEFTEHPLAASRDLALADFDGDGRPDLALLRTDDVVELRQSSDGSAELPAPGAVGLVAADFDGDGRPDLALGQPVDVDRPGGVHLRFNDGGTWHEGPAVGRGAIAGLLAYDADGDALADLLMLRRDGGQVLHLGQAGRRFTRHPQILTSPAVAAASADLDRDGRADLLLARGPAAGFDVYFGDGTGGQHGQLAEPQPPSSGGTTGWAEWLLAALLGLAKCAAAHSRRHRT